MTLALIRPTTAFHRADKRKRHPPVMQIGFRRGDKRKRHPPVMQIGFCRADKRKRHPPDNA